ncbi:hypothetical protein FNV43_RR15448 [Rhamnella rubrinervis]|uniref:Uncharacterized protein n=1 Tax=Rhamnella rubrinervis TaxID=2594499 RepID=A0A8K0GWT0_9ROSA|nr:hypothetical protein FNV43_RR15448 [Rhamnella rubrinervis]
MCQSPDKKVFGNVALKMYIRKAFDSVGLSGNFSLVSHQILLVDRSILTSKKDFILINGVRSSLPISSQELLFPTHLLYARRAHVLREDLSNLTGVFDASLLQLFRVVVNSTNPHLFWFRVSPPYKILADFSRWVALYLSRFPFKGSPTQLFFHHDRILERLAWKGRSLRWRSVVLD